MKNIKAFIISLLIPQIAGVLGSIFTSSNIESWYKGLNKPVFTPPNWLFAPAWTILFILMGISLYFVYISDISNDRKLFLIFFFIQLFLNFFWNVLFFGLHNPLLGLIEILILIVTVGITIYFAFRVNNVSGYFLIPYILWLLFATALNIGILVLN
jgi:tryptophan-rich sensory protein